MPMTMGEFRELTADVPDDQPIQLSLAGAADGEFTFHDADASVDLTNRRVVISRD
jgi:hypothetical protein